MIGNRASLTCLHAAGILLALSCFLAAAVFASDKPGEKQRPPSPVRTAPVEKRDVSSQISMVGTVEAQATSIVAAEESGVVESFPVKEGDFVKKGKTLVRLRSTDLKLRRKAAVAVRESTRANLDQAKKELDRNVRLREVNSIAARSYDEALSRHTALTEELNRSTAEVERLDYQIRQTTVPAPFSGFVSKEHTYVGQFIDRGGSVVTLVDLSHVRVTVDVPERYAVLIESGGHALVNIRSIGKEPLKAKVAAVLPVGNATARTFPIRVDLKNPGFRIRPGMEAFVSFDLSTQKSALLVPKDAVVTHGSDRLVFTVLDGKAVPIPVRVDGYYDGHVAVIGRLKPGMPVVVRGNERLRPGQAVQVAK